MNASSIVTHRTLAAAASMAMLAVCSAGLAADAVPAAAPAAAPRIGLALSGGGARGIALIFALTYLVFMPVLSALR